MNSFLIKTFLPAFMPEKKISMAFLYSCYLISQLQMIGLLLLFSDYYLDYEQTEILGLSFKHILKISMLDGSLFKDTFRNLNNSAFILIGSYWAVVLLLFLVLSLASLTSNHGFVSTLRSVSRYLSLLHTKILFLPILNFLS